MDPMVMAAGTALVTAMATEGWQQARAGAVALWRRVHPKQAEMIETELEEVRGEVLAARQASDRSAEDALATEWRRRLARLVAADPAVGIEIQQVLDRVWKPLLPEADQARVQHITQQATASGHGQIYQAGRNQSINK